MILLIFNQELHTSGLILSLTFSVTSRHVLVLQFSISVALSHPISSILSRSQELIISTSQSSQKNILRLWQRRNENKDSPNKLSAALCVLLVGTLYALGGCFVHCTRYNWYRLIQSRSSESLHTYSTVLSLHCGSTHPNRLPKSILAAAFCDFACICLLSSYFQ